MTIPDYVPNGAESITDHGATRNPDDPDLTAAELNVQAFDAACNAAGNGGDVYIPEGEFYLGVGFRSTITGFGDVHPAGISIYGAGAGKSMIAVTENMDDSVGHNLLEYEAAQHGSPTIRGVHLDGNYENIGNLYNADSGSRGVEFDWDAEMDSFDFKDCLLRGFWLSAVRGRAAKLRFENCTFAESGVGAFNDAEATANGEHISCSPRDGNAVEVVNCELLNTPGFGIEFWNGVGEVIINNSHIVGAGAGCVRHSTEGALRMNNVFAQARTQWLVENIPSYKSDTPPMHGRHFYRRFEGADNPTVEMNHVEFRDSTFAAFYTHKSSIELSGDMIAVHKGCQEHNDMVFHVGGDSQRESGFQNTDIDRLSVHDSNGAVFNLELDNSSGEVNTLHRNGNAGGLGYTDGLTVNDDNAGGQPFKPTVPSKKEVGANLSTGPEIVSWSWFITHPDGTSETLDGETVSFEPQSNGEYEVELTVENDLGLIDRASDILDY